MGKEKEICLLLGCGQKGLEWVVRQKDESTLCLDQDTGLVKFHPEVVGKEASYSHLLHFVIGDAFSLPLEKGSVNKIQVDFFLNAVFPRGVTFVDVRMNPTILQVAPFPPPVRKWYRETLQFSDESVDNHLITIRWLLRAFVLEQMWEILAKNGEIIIVDKKDIIHWVENNAAIIFRIDPGDIEIGSLPITPDDHERSGAESLKVIRRYPNAVKKIILKKHW